MLVLMTATQKAFWQLLIHAWQDRTLNINKLSTWQPSTATLNVNLVPSPRKVTHSFLRIHASYPCLLDFAIRLSDGLESCGDGLQTFQTPSNKFDR
jgi:hypothetical protein